MGLLLREQRLGGGAITLGAFDRVLERLFTRLYGSEERLERELRQHDEQEDEDDQRPRHHADIRVEQVRRTTFSDFRRESRSGGSRESNSKRADTAGGKSEHGRVHEKKRMRRGVRMDAPHAITY